MNYWDYTGGGDYLSHHGIEGQSWGDRNGPPYPLSRQGINDTKQYLKDLKKRDAIKSRQKEGYKKTRIAAAVVGAATGANAYSTARNQHMENNAHRHAKLAGNYSSRKIYKQMTENHNKLTPRMQERVGAPTKSSARLSAKLAKKTHTDTQAAIALQAAATVAGTIATYKLATLPKSDEKELAKIDERIREYESKYGKYKVSDLERTVKLKG